MASRYYNPLWQLTLAKTRELWREPEALFWVFGFPLVLALVLGVAFRSKAPEEIPIGVAEGSEAEWVASALEGDAGLRPRVLDLAEAHSELRAGRVALVVIPEQPWTYWYDPDRPDSRLAWLAVDQALQTAAGRSDPRVVESRELRERGSRYIDFLIPGLIGMNLMGTGIWGICFSIVNARSRRILKRLAATPMRRSEFLASQLSGRLIYLLPEVGLLLLFAVLVFDVPVRGSPLALAAVTIVGGLAFAGFGLLVASRVRTIEAVSGLSNLVTLPMWIMSGIFFSTARFPDAIQPLVQVLPLTAVNDALRAIMLEGASLVAVSGELAIAAAWGLASFALALALFRWS
jgi:ABC-type multidrug transport system permease subunit